PSAALFSPLGGPNWSVATEGANRSLAGLVACRPLRMSLKLSNPLGGGACRDVDWVGPSNPEQPVTEKAATKTRTIRPAATGANRPLNRVLAPTTLPYF